MRSVVSRRLHRRCAFALACTAVASVACAADQAPRGPQPSRCLELQIAAPSPFAAPATVWLRIVDTTESPVGLGIDDESFAHDPLAAFLPGAGDSPWGGPATGAALRTDPTKLALDAAHGGDARPPLLLFGGEGYARRLRVADGFLADPAFAKQKGAILQALAVVWEQREIDRPSTPRPGVAPTLGEPVDVAVGRTIAVPLGRATGHAHDAAPTPTAAATLALQVVSARAGEDVVVAYLVAAADRPVWLWQNAIGAVNASFAIADAARKPLATVDGAALKDRAAWLPKRAAWRVDPGEALVVVRSLPAKALRGAAKGKPLRIALTLAALIATAPPADDAAPPAPTALTASCEVVPE